jgi:hypothetical protein
MLEGQEPSDRRDRKKEQRRPVKLFHSCMGEFKKLKRLTTALPSNPGIIN